jgi:ketosteroid isomerase-like protein
MKALSVAVVLSVLPFQAISEESKGGDAFSDVQTKFAEAYNRKDIEAMATAFSETAIRVTPSGVFQGRDAIRRNFEAVLSLGLREYSVRRTGSRSLGDLVFNYGEWQAKLGDQPFRGYYTAILGREGDQVRILEETVTIAAP